MKVSRMVTKAALNLNGISIAYVMGFVNAGFAVLVAFGVELNSDEIASVTALINAAMILAVHFGHRVGEATASGASANRSEQTFGSQQAPPEAPPVNG